MKITARRGTDYPDYAFSAKITTYDVPRIGEKYDTWSNLISGRVY